MKCPKCNGNKEIHTPIYTQGNPFMPSGWEYRTCEYCNGTGEVEQTNEEWIKSANTEQLAEFICGIQTDGALQVDCMTYEERLMWLKQPHTTRS